MPSDYAKIRDEQSDVEQAERFGEFLAGLYSDRSHFTLELLQNAEDALRPIMERAGTRRVRFRLSDDEVQFSHFGRPFNEADVRAVCGILVSTKDGDTEIGRFGVGFKSVGAITDRPRIHSGAEHFDIRRYVLPHAIPPIDLERGETVIVLPFKPGVDKAGLAPAFEDLGARTLLFLREINQIEWSVTGGHSGHYVRSDHDGAADASGPRRVTLRGETRGADRTEEEWLLFARDVPIEGKPPRRIEIAFNLSVNDSSEDSDKYSVSAVRGSPLFAFFETALETHLGLLVQGPYRTTPGRDNIKRDDDWNRYLIGETADLLVEALRYLRDHALLTPRVFDALPLDRARFEGGFFAPLFDAVHKAVASEPLLPAHRRGGRSHIPASQAWLTEDAGLRNLISRGQLGEIADADGPAGWLSDGITADGTPALYNYLTDEHDVEEIGLHKLLWRFRSHPRFLRDQPDNWIQRLYGFLHKQDPGLGALAGVPLIRLENGSHIAPAAHGRTDAYLPTDPPSAFPNTVRRKVCSTTPAREFLKQLGLSEPDRVDHLIRNVIPRYRGQPEVKPREYAADLRTMIGVYRDASPEQRRKLTEELRECAFVRAADAATGELSFVRPGEAYLETQRLRDLFEGVPSVLLTAAPPRGVSRRDMRDLLTPCGVSRTLAPVTTREEVDRWRQTSRFSHEELRYMRIEEQGTDNITWNRDEFLTDSMFRWLKELIDHMQGLASETASRKARLLWEALCAVQDAKAFEGSYHWYYYNPKNHAFPSASVRLLNEAPWVPDESGVLQPPGRVLFDSLGWTKNQLVLSQIDFRPPAIEAIAKRAGIDTGLLEVAMEVAMKAKKQGVSRDKLRELLSPAEPSASQDAPASGDGDDASSPGEALMDALREVGQPPRAAEEVITAAGGAGGVRPGGGATGSREAARQVVRGAGGNDAPGGGSDAGGGSGAGGRSSGGGGARTFVSHIAVGAESEGEPDPDAQERRMGLEEAAIARIEQDEPALRRTPPGNAGFDLYEADDAGEIVRWVEVKSVRGGWESGPVSMSHTQFGMAREKGDAYWLYVVEHAGTDRANIVRIRDPAGRASTYTFDKGWREAPPP